MAEFICPDCGMKTDKLVSTTRTCILCYKRYQNKKSHNEEYVPLVNIKGTKEYNRAMGRRLGALKRKNEKQSIKIEEPKTKSTVDVIKSSIMAIENYEYIDILPNDIANAIKVLANAIKNRNKIERLTAIISEDLLVISHKKEKTDGPGDKAYDELAKKEFVLLKYRRQLKDVLAYLNAVNSSVLSDDTIKNIDSLDERLSENEYKPKYESCNSYNVTVNVSGLNGCSRVEPFTRFVYAKNPAGAKSYVENFLKGLNSVTIFGRSWKVEEVEKNVDIENIKEGLQI